MNETSVLEVLGAALTNTDKKKSTITTEQYFRNIERVDPAFPYRIHQIIRERILKSSRAKRKTISNVPSHDDVSKVKKSMAKDLRNVLRSIRRSNVEKRARDTYETGFLRRRRRSSSFETGVVWTLRGNRPRLPSVEEINDCVDRYCNEGNTPPPLDYKRDLLHSERFNDLVETLCSSSSRTRNSENHNKLLFEMFLEGLKTSPIQAAVILCTTLVHVRACCEGGGADMRRYRNIVRTCLEMLKRSSLVLTCCPADLRDAVMLHSIDLIASFSSSSSSLDAALVFVGSDGEMTWFRNWIHEPVLRRQLLMFVRDTGLLRYSVRVFLRDKFNAVLCMNLLTCILPHYITRDAFPLEIFCEDGNKMELFDVEEATLVNSNEDSSLRSLEEILKRPKRPRTVQLRTIHRHLVRCVLSKDCDVHRKNICLDCLRMCASRGLDAELWKDLIRSSVVVVHDMLEEAVLRMWSVCVCLFTHIHSITRPSTHSPTHTHTHTHLGTYDSILSKDESLLSCIFEECWNNVKLLRATSPLLTYDKGMSAAQKHGIIKFISTKCEETKIWRDVLMTVRGTISLGLEKPRGVQIERFRDDLYSTLQLLHGGFFSSCDDVIVKEIEQRYHTTTSDLVIDKSLVWLISMLQTMDNAENVTRIVTHKIKSPVVALYVLESVDVDDSISRTSTTTTYNGELETLLRKRLSIRKSKKFIQRPFETLVEIETQVLKDLPSHVSISPSIFLLGGSRHLGSRENTNLTTQLYSMIQDESDVSMCNMLMDKTVKDQDVMDAIRRYFQHKDLQHALYEQIECLDRENFLITSETVERSIREISPELWGAIRMSQCPILHITSMWWRRRRFLGLLPWRLLALYSILCRHAPKLCRIHFTLTALFHLKTCILESASGISDLPLCVLIQRPFLLPGGVFWIRDVDDFVRELKI